MIMLVEFCPFFVLIFIIVTLFFSRRNQHHKYERKRCNKIILLNVIWPIIFYVLRGKHISEVEKETLIVKLGLYINVREGNQI